MQNAPLLRERLKHSLHGFWFCGRQVPLTGHFQIVIRLIRLQRLAGNIHRRLQNAGHLILVALHRRKQRLAHTGQRQPRIMFVNEVGGLVQLGLAIALLGMNDPVLHFALVEHQNNQHPIARQGQKLHLPQLDHLKSWQRDHTRHASDLRQHARGRINQVRGRHIWRQALAQISNFLLR